MAVQSQGFITFCSAALSLCTVAVDVLAALYAKTLHQLDSRDWATLSSMRALATMGLVALQPRLVRICGNSASLGAASFALNGALLVYLGVRHRGRMPHMPRLPADGVCKTKHVESVECPTLSRRSRWSPWNVPASF